MLLNLRTVTGRPLATAVLLVAFAATGATAPQATESKSAAVAKELSQVLDAAKLDSIAAADPTDVNGFVAALYFQGAQLLVVSAKYAAPSLLVTKINAKEYRDIYIDLQSASMAGSKIFVQDQLADGLIARPGNDAAPDSWENGPKIVLFDGDHKKAKVSEADYLKTYNEADAKYAQMLTLLLAKAKAKSGT